MRISGGFRPARDENKYVMPEYEKIRFHNSCSIGLYVSNLMGKVVPEKNTQISHWNLGIRLLTPDGVAFNALGRCVKAKPNQAVSSFRWNDPESSNRDYAIRSG